MLSKSAPLQNTSQSPAQRRQWLDAAKGVGIALIVWGHIYSITEPTALQVYVYAFHVPLFFLVSGLTFRPEHQTLKQVFRAKARVLLLPYLCYALLGYAFYLCGYGFAHLSGLQLKQFDYGLLPPLLGVFYGSLGDGHLVNTPVWFVIALFCTLVLGQAINQCIESPLVRGLVIAALAAFGYWIPSFAKLPFSLAPAMLGLVFFQTGYWMKDLAFSARRSQRALWAVFLLGVVISAFSQINGFVAMATPSVGALPWFLVFGLAGSLMVLAGAQLLEPHGAWLAWLGRYSLSIMLIHFLIIKSVKVVLAAVGHFDMATLDNSTSLGALTLAATALLLLPTVHFMERFLPWTLGKKPPELPSQMKTAT